MSFDLYEGDCFSHLPSVSEKSIDLVVVDPPYGTTTIQWDKTLDFTRMWAELDRICKDDTNLIFFASQPFTSLLVCSKLDWFRYELIWNKNKCGSPGLSKYRPLKTHENILVFSKKPSPRYFPIMETGKPYERECKDKERGYGSGKNTHGYGFGKLVKMSNSGTRYPKSVLHCSRNFSAQQTVHPTQKPTNLLSWLIMTYSSSGDTVLDFTMGSGSTGVAAVETGRKFIGMEKDHSYFEIARNRISTTTENSVSCNDKLLTTQNEFMLDKPKSAVETVTETGCEFFQ